MLKKVVTSACLHLLKWSLFRKVAHKAARVPLLRPFMKRSIHKITSIKGKRDWVETRFGWMLLEPYWEVPIYTAFREPEMTSALLPLLTPNACFYDLGAHIGFYSLLAAGKGCRKIFAFEPYPENAEICREVFRRNGISGEVIEAAVSDHDGSAFLASSPGIHNACRLSADEGTKVRMLSLDSFCQRALAPTVLKIDVEGAEVKVIEGAMSVIRSAKPELIIEIHDEKFPPILRDMLCPLGYEASVLLEGWGGHILFSQSHGPKAL